MNCIKGSGSEASEDRKVGEFTQIKVSGAYKVILKQDSSFNLHVTADDNLLKYISSEVQGGCLTIGGEKSVCSKTPAVITIGFHNMERIQGSGAVEFVSAGKLNVKDLDIDVSGANKINLDINAANLTTKGSGSTDIQLKGQAASHNVSFTGTGSLNAFDLVVGKYNLETTGSSDCKINVLTQLDIHTTGAADVQYKGNPGTINNDKTGAITIKKVE